MLKPLSLTAYAKHRRTNGLAGGTLKAVQRAVKGMRVTTDPHGRIPDAEAADREWAERTDHTRRPGFLDQIAAGLDDDEEDAGPDKALGTAALREKHYKALQAELNYEARAGELVNAQAIAAEYSGRCSVVRTRMLGIPSSLKQRHPELERDVLVTLETLIRDGLADLARGATT